MDNKIIACILYKNLSEIECKDKNILIYDLFKITKSTLYRWINEYNDTINNINERITFDFKSDIITKPIVCSIIYYVLSNIDISYKKIKKELNKQFDENHISFKHINCIINANKHIFNKFDHNKKNYKLIPSIQKFIIDSINNNNCLTANEIYNLIENKFKITISLTTIYNFFKKNNYVYKKTVININPYSYYDQKQQLTNVYNHLINNDDHIILDNIKNELTEINNLIKEEISDISLKNNIHTNSTFLINKQNNIKKMNDLLKQEIDIIKNEGIISIDEMSIITNRACTKGWSLKNKECIIYIPFLKPNVRYSLLMATSKKKIIKYHLVKGSIKTDDYILFMTELNDNNPNYTYLIDNASIHKNKKTNEFYKKNHIHIVYNAPYQSKFNPIEMVFSLLRKKLNKQVVKSKEEIDETIKLFQKEIKEETLTNIFNHSIKLLKEYLKI
jgi:hypothetical protein